MKIDNSIPQLFTHPSCSCGPVIELVRMIGNENKRFKFKEISLINSEGRKRAQEVGVKMIPTLWFPDGILLVGSNEITKEKIEEKI